MPELFSKEIILAEVHRGHVVKSGTNPSDQILS
jgi:hypothetical protein